MIFCQQSFVNYCKILYVKQQKPWGLILFINFFLSFTFGDQWNGAWRSLQRTLSKVSKSLWIRQFWTFKSINKKHKSSIYKENLSQFQYLKKFLGTISSSKWIKNVDVLTSQPAGNHVARSPKVTKKSTEYLLKVKLVFAVLFLMNRYSN